MLNFSNRRFAVRIGLLGLVTLLLSCSLLAQTTISTGSIVGTVTDPTGAVVGGAKVLITNKGTSQVITSTTTSAGAFASGALTPGDYAVRVEASGFKAAQTTVVVQVNTTASANIKLAVGESSQVVEVQASELAVNTEQATVQGVLTTEQIENLPINGRNFLDLAQLEPGVQIQDGGTFDPTKNGFSSVSFGGRFGRTARIEVDGVDVSDETVGTTTQNVPLGAIQESSLQQSSLDLSTELTSSGSVNITTKSGTNALHGEGFYYFRDQSLNAAMPGHSTNYFQRNQFGGSVGGPILKDKLFFFIDAERNKQALIDPVIPGGDFTDLHGSFVSAFPDTELLGRVDYNVGKVRTFYRFSFEQNRSVLPFIPNSFQPFANVNHSRNHIVGADFNTGSFSHSIRFGYSKFQNGITDAVTGSTIFNPGGKIELAIGADPLCLTAGLDDFCSGPNFLAPQATLQTDHQIKYDGSKPFKNHIFRFGAGVNHLQGGGFAAFLGSAPAVFSASLASGTPLPCVAAGNCPDLAGSIHDPLNYPAQVVVLGNGEGFGSAKKSFGYPGGGLGPDNRLSLYFGDSWKVKPNFTLTLGLRYVRDTGRTDSDLGPTPALNVFNNQFYSGLGNRVNQPNLNFSPQLGFAWDPNRNGKTVIRGGAGLFYENSIWNNILFDPAGRLQKGFFLATTGACPSTPAGLTFPDGTVITRAFLDANICNQPIGSASPAIQALQQQYQAATVAAGAAVNPSYVGSTNLSGIDINTTSLIAPNYKSSRSVQMNIGIQREIRRGMVFTVDYLRNVSTHNLLSIDTNHVGDARFFNAAAASAAVATTIADCGGGVTTIAQTYGGPCATDPANGTNDGGLYVPRPANIGDFAGHGLDSGYKVCGGGPCPNAAFGGVNLGATGANQMLFPIGRSVYNGLQMTFKQDVHNPFRGIKYMNLQVSYSLSRYVSTARDSDFINFPTDYANPLGAIGPNGLDRTHQLSFGGVMDLPADFKLSLIGHFDSPLASNLNLPTGPGPGGIFQTDLTGDGTGDGVFADNGGLGDLLPGTKLGSFGRDVSVSSLNKLINNFNTTIVGTPTPAGKVLLSNGFTQADLTALGAVIGPGLQPAPAGAIGQSWLKTFDLGLNWGYKIKERVEIRPGVTFFNVFNFSNFDGPAIPFSSVLGGGTGSPNGTTSAGLHGGSGNFLRLGLGSGVNSLGAPRVMEFELKIIF
jgi:hypothetical protein